MATTTTKTNKPILPRGADNRPVDSYNRAKLFSGKALDFDGVNDYVDGGTLDITNYTQMSMSFYFKAHSTTSDWRLISIRYIGSDDIRIFHATSVGAGKLSFALDDGTAVTFSEDFTTNEWYHVVMTHDGTTLKAYFNGVLVQSAASDFNYSGTDGLFYIGRYTGGTFSYYDGEFANYKLFNTALTAAQVADLYNNPEKVVPTGVANTALKLWLPMQEGAGTTAYDGAADLTDYVTNGDFSDGTNNWTASNATLSVEGGALKVTSTGGNRPQGYQTITGLTIGRKYLLSAVARVGTTSYNMEIEISGIGASGSYNKTTNSTDTYIYTEFTAGSTTHIVQAKIDDSNVPAGETGFFDDIKLLDLGNYGTISGATWTHGIGASVSQTSVIDWNKWYLDHTNEVLVPQGLTSGRDLLGNLFENVRKQGALNLDGKSWAEVHDNESLDFGTGSFSLEAWVKAKYTSSGSVYNAILTLGGDIVASNNCGLALDSSLKPYIIYNTNASVGPIQNEGDWVHIVGNYDGTKSTLYVNGSQVDQDTISAGTITNTNTKMIGKGASTNRIYSDQIAQPRIYNRALTAEEVLNNYNATSSLYI